MDKGNKKKPEKEGSFQVSRRDFMKGLGIGSVAVSTGVFPKRDAQGHLLREDLPPERAPITLRVNGTKYRIDVAHRWTLADVLRDHLGLTGTKIGCNKGECGACTVLLDGKAVYSCSNLAVWAEGRDIVTIEGLAQGDELHPIQKAFIEHDGMQCGFCTSGQIMASKALLDENPHPTEMEVKRALSGNLCRCGNYNRIVEAVMAAGTELSKA